MIAPLLPRRIVSTVWLPALLVTTDFDLQARFLGNAPEEACEAAVWAGDPRMTASAVHSLETRLEAFTAWRGKQVVALLGSVPVFREFFNKAEPELRESISSGKVALAEIEGMISTARAELLHRQAVARTDSKNALRAAILAALRDCDGSEERTLYPGFLAILENGEVGLFCRRGPCLEWARASGGRFLMGVFERGAFVLNPAPAVD